MTEPSVLVAPAMRPAAIAAPLIVPSGRTAPVTVPSMTPPGLTLIDPIELLSSSLQQDGVVRVTADLKLVEPGHDRTRSAIPGRMAGLLMSSYLEPVRSGTELVGESHAAVSSSVSAWTSETMRRRSTLRALAGLTTRP